MRKYLIHAFLLAGIVLLIRNLHVVLMELPDDAAQGPIYRILFFHVPSFFAAGIGFMAVFIGSVMYLIKRDLRYDSFAASVNEISVIFWTIGTALGSLWGRVIWGIWWTWDARLTSVFVAWLMGVSYMILRTSIDEPNQRARLCSVLSILVTADLPIVWYSIEWFRTQHPAPVLRGGGSIDPAMKAAIYANVWPLLLIGAALVLIRLRQEEMRREIDGLRRLVHALEPETDEFTMDPRNFTYMFYGFTVAWLLVTLYVLSLHIRERKIQDELSRLKNMMEDRERERK